MKSFSLILIGIIIGGGVFWLGMRFNPNATSKNNAAETQDTKDAGSKVGDSLKNITLGESPYLGNKDKAKVAIVEFSDLECPYCKQFHDKTFDQIVKNYVDTNKAILVFKNYPLSFHKPAAETDANAAFCINEIAGREKYFQMIQLIYKNTGLNGKGMPKEKFLELAGQLDVDKNAFEKCFDSTIFESKIQKDFDDGTAVGVSGTPGFVIGKLDSNGNITGELLTGAQPFEAFKSIIDKKLNAN